MLCREQRRLFWRAKCQSLEFAEQGLSDAMMDRLLLDDARISAIADSSQHRSPR